MKIYIGPYVDRWVSTVHDHYMRNKYSYNDWPETQTGFENFLEKLEDVLQWIYNHSINLYLDKKQRKIKVKIHNYDTWSMDHTLAYIVVPMLKQLKETKHGAPFVDNKDVPKELRMSEKELDQFHEDGTSDNKFFARYDWVLDEMIWAFEQKCRDDWMEDYDYNKWDSEGVKAHQERMSNGFRLFGKYYETLWD